MPNKTEPSSLRFNCYLIREDIVDLEHVLRAKYRSSGNFALEQIAPSPAAPDGSVAYLGASTERTPKWASGLDRLFPGIGQVTNRSNRLVVFLPVENRWFAVCFGYGSSTLEWDAIEGNFGLRVAARIFRANEVTEFRSRRIDASARTQSVHVPIGADLKDFGVELDGEFVRRLSGSLESGGVEVDGSVIASDSISFKAETDLYTVQHILRQMLERAAEATSIEAFQFIDALEPLRSSEETSRILDEELASRILTRGQLTDDGTTINMVPDRGRMTHLLEFALPDEIRYDDVDDVVVTHRGRSVVLATFTMEGLRLALREVGVRRGVGFLKSVRLVARGADGDERSQSLPLRNWLVFEVGDSSIRYILTLGRWFRLQEDYTLKLNRDLAKIKDVSDILHLPDTLPKETEPGYNKRAALADDNLLWMDTDNMKTGDRTQVETCDLLHRSGYLIHVKRYNKSQTLSHLFSQGAVSAELLNGDDVAKNDFVAKVCSKDQSFQETAVGAPERVTYAIAIKDGYNLPYDLPTFSKVNLRDFINRLARMKVEATFARIRVVEFP